MHYVIVGAGPAGVIAAETLSQADREGSITLIGDEPEPPYSRMALPYLLADNIDEAGAHLRHDPDHYWSLGIDVPLVKGSDPFARRSRPGDRKAVIDGMAAPWSLV